MSKEGPLKKSLFRLEKIRLKGLIVNTCGNGQLFCCVSEQSTEATGSTFQLGTGKLSNCIPHNEVVPCKHQRASTGWRTISLRC